MSSRTVVILCAAVAIGVTGGAVLGLSRRDDADHAADHGVTAATSASTLLSQATATPPAQTTASDAWLRTTQLSRAVARVASSRNAEVGVAVRPLGVGDPVGFGNLRTGAAWSTIKAPLALAHYRKLPETSDALVASALRRSDNAAAQQLFDELAQADDGVAGASSDIQDVLRASGDDRTVVNTKQPAGGFSTYGQTDWSLAMGTRFFSALARGCLKPKRGASRILALMSEVVPDQQWGIGRAHFGGADTIRFKGGWGPARDGRYLVRQFGIVETSDGRGIALAIAARASNGTFAGGIAVLDDLAAAAAGATRLTRSPRKRGC